MPYPGRNNIYEATIRRMVSEALEAQEQEFIQNCGRDTDAQLLSYLRECSRQLEHTPWPREITGGSLLVQRFGSWENALKKAELPAPSFPDKPTAFVRYREETQRQKERYREKKAARKQRAQLRQSLQNKKQKK